jgi:predicted MFS family arabinose efflux permease
LSFVLLVGAMFSTFFFSTQFMQKVLGYSPLRTGFAFLPLTLLLFTVSRFVPRLLPRFGARPLIMTGTGLVSLGLFWLSRITPGTHFATGLLGPLMMFGIGAGLGFSPLAVIILSGLKPQDSGSGSGLMQACQQVGGALGLSVLVTVFSSAARGSHDRNPLVNYTHGLSTALTVGAVFAFCVFLIGATMKANTQRAPH